MLETLIIIGANGLCVVVCYVLGYRKGTLDNTHPGLDGRKCTCGHKANSHKLSKDTKDWMNCSVTMEGNTRAICSCQKYMPDVSIGLDL